MGIAVPMAIRSSGRGSGYLWAYVVHHTGPAGRLMLQQSTNPVVGPFVLTFTIGIIYNEGRSKTLTKVDGEEGEQIVLGTTEDFPSNGDDEEDE